MKENNECCEKCSFKRETSEVNFVTCINSGCPDCHTPTESKGESWEEELRDLYLTTSPDEKNLHTKSITFEWGSFAFYPSKGNVAFYLTTQNAIEDFISNLLTSEREAMIAEIEKLKKIEYIPSDVMYDTQTIAHISFNAALNEVISLLTNK